MRFFNNRHGNKNEERDQAADDEDFHAIFEIQDLDSLDIEEMADGISENQRAGDKLNEPSGQRSETITRNIEVKNSEGETTGELPGDTRNIDAPDGIVKSGLPSSIIWNNKGVTLSRLGRYTEAIEAFNQALTIDPDYSSAWNNKGVTLSRLGRYTEAIEAFDQALAIKPDYLLRYGNQIVLKSGVSIPT